MFNDISCGSRDKKKEGLSNANLVSQYANRFGEGQWSFIGPGSEKKWYCVSEDSPLSRGQLRSKGHGKLSIHYCADQATSETIFLMIVTANQLSLYGAVANMCEEYESFPR